VALYTARNANTIKSVPANSAAERLKREKNLNLYIVSFILDSIPAEERALPAISNSNYAAKQNLNK
jgi:hypothetical protein